MIIAAIIQARMDSKRLPGKVLKIINKKPLLWHIISSLENCKNLGKIIIATSDAHTDDPIVDFSKQFNIECYRGSLNYVANRMHDAAKYYKIDTFVRVCGDSPLIDHHLVDQAIEIYQSQKCDLVTNVFPRTFPKGQTIEVISTSALKRALEIGTNENEQEHMTQFFYNNHELFKIVSFTNSDDLSQIQLSVDTEEDFRLCSEILDKLHDYKIRTWKDSYHLLNKIKGSHK